MAELDLQDIKEQANFLIEADRNQEAIVLLTHALNLAPDDAETLCLLAQAALELALWRDAWRYVERAIAVEPDNDWAHRIHSIVLRNMARRHESVAAAKEAVRLGPMVPHNWHTLASAQLHVFNLKEARASAESLRELAPSWYLSHQMLALVALKEEKHKDAEASCRRELELNPNSYHGLNNLGVALLNQKRQREAIEAFTLAAKLNPAAPIARANISAAAAKYLPRVTVPIFGFWIILNALRVAGQKGGALAATVIVGILVCLYGGVFVVRKYRYRRLPPEVKTYLETTKRRAQRRKGMSRQQWWIAGMVVCAVLFLVWLAIFWIDWQVGRNFPELTNFIFPLVVLLGLAGCVIGYRRTMEASDETSD
jgi:tetratricopeptide (TPR) repeat protein